VNEAGLFGGRLDIPPVTDDAGDPSQQIQQLAERLGRELPPDFGQIPVFTSDSLEEAQQALKLVRRGAILLLIVTLILVVVTILLSTNRWRTVAQLGIGLAIAMLVMIFVARWVDRRIKDIITNPDAVPSARAITQVFTDSLQSVAVLLLVIGIVVALVGFVFGRSDAAARVRASAARTAARAGGAVSTGSPFTAFVVGHAAAVRLGAVAIGAVILWWSGFSTGGAVVALIVTAVLLLVIELLIRRAGDRVQAT
jgi:phosphoglycerol transferase MdoB-like AlkP superfamily enzyme